MIKNRTTYQIALVFGFMLILILPSVFEVVGIKFESQDNRELAKKPDLKSKDFNAKMEAYYTDRYGLRNKLIELGGFLKAELFKSSSKPDIVQIGKEGWLFYNAKGDYIYNSYSNRNILNEDELNWFHYEFMNKKKYCDSLNVDYWFIVWPNKHTVYPEYLSWQMNLQKGSDFSKREQIQQFLKERNEDHYIDVTDQLVPLKGSERIYLKYDTHWNLFGAYFAYRILMDSIKLGGVEPIRQNSFEILQIEERSGDLVKLMGRKELSIPDHIPVFNYKGDLDTTILQYVHQDIMVNDFTNNGKPDLDQTLLIFGDSYVERIQWFFLFHFKRVVFVKTGFRKDFIDFFKADIVFEAKVERYL